MPAESSARSQARSTARLRVSSPMPGANSFVPSRRTFTSVPAGNTVSRCAATQISGPLPIPRRMPVTLPSVSISKSLSPCAFAISNHDWARTVSLNEGDSISVRRTMSSTVRSCSAARTSAARRNASLVRIRCIVVSAWPVIRVVLEACIRFPARCRGAGGFVE
jgi:hypothetical protein